MSNKGRRCTGMTVGYEKQMQMPVPKTGFEYAIPEFAPSKIVAP
jgi:hypothetical protein